MATCWAEEERRAGGGRLRVEAAEEGAGVCVVRARPTRECSKGVGADRSSGRLEVLLTNWAKRGELCLFPCGLLCVCASRIETKGGGCSEMLRRDEGTTVARRPVSPRAPTRRPRSTDDARAQSERARRQGGR
jgi:hypothetical protein